jgi:ornithine carbamoyltransferase
MPNADIIECAREFSEASGSTVVVITDPLEAAKDADIIYTDTFVSMGLEEERSNRLRTFIPKYQVTTALMSHAKDSAIFMHCLPAHRGEEVANEVIDGKWSVVWDQAENRLHMQKAILRWLLVEQS